MNFYLFIEYLSTEMDDYYGCCKVWYDRKECMQLKIL